MVAKVMCQCRGLDMRWIHLTRIPGYDAVPPNTTYNYGWMYMEIYHVLAGFGAGCHVKGDCRGSDLVVIMFETLIFSLRLESLTWCFNMFYHKPVLSGSRQVWPVLDMQLQSHRVLTLRRGQEVDPVAIASQDTLIWFRK